MIAYQSWTAGADDGGAVRRPAPGDALGSALRSVYVETVALPEEMVRLLRQIDRETHRH